MLLLFAASTWPIHQLGEDYLYSAHMLQHMMLSYFMPPLVLLATPEWLLRILVGKTDKQILNMKYMFIWRKTTGQGAEQSREACRGVKTWQAQPVD